MELTDRKANSMDQMKTCPDCDQEKPIEHFGPDKRNTSGVKRRCRPCERERQYAWRRANPERWRAIEQRNNAKRRGTEQPWAAKLKRYGITPERYHELLNGQGGVCAICGGQPHGRGSRLHVDHDHACCPRTKSSVSCGNCIRGLLCGNCNTALGLMKDDPARLLAAVRYLVKKRK